MTPEEVRGREEGRKREAQRKKDVVPTRFCATSVYGRARIDMLVQVEKSERVNTRERGGRERGADGAKCTGGGWGHVYDTPGAHTLEVPVIHGDLRGRFRLPLAERPCACRRTSARVHAHRVKPSRSHSDVEQGLARPSTCPPIRIE